MDGFSAGCTVLFEVLMMDYPQVNTLSFGNHELTW